MTEPTWLSRARSDIGTKEAPGPADNAKIIGWARALGGWVASFYMHDSIPWCALCMAHWMFADGKKLPAQDSILAALKWRSWGQAIPRAIPGAVLIFERSGGGHIGLYVGEDSVSYHVLGGNQGDQVCIERIAKSRCVAIRWPAESKPIGQPLMVASSTVPESTTQA